MIPKEVLIGRQLLSISGKMYQQNPAWSDVKIGTGQRTIGKIGCALGAFTGLLSMLSNIVWSMRQVDYLLTFNKGYVEHNLISWHNVCKLFPISLELIENYEKDEPANLNKVEPPFIAKIDFIPDTEEVDHHYILVISKKNGKYFAIDPIDGEVFELLTKYSKPDWSVERLILKIIAYRRDTCSSVMSLKG